jgi:hypothetical protein
VVCTAVSCLALVEEPSVGQRAGPLGRGSNQGNTKN